MGKTEQVQFRVPSQLKDDFQRAAAEVHRPASQILRELMRDFVNSVPPQTIGRDTPVEITAIERRDRADAVALGRASVALEGLTVSQEARELQDMFANGEITFEDCIAAIKKSLASK